jgi:hypothetical protein
VTAAHEMALRGQILMTAMRPPLDEPQGLASLLALVHDVTYAGLGPAIDFPEMRTYLRDAESKYLTAEEIIEFDALAEESGEKARDYALSTSRPRFSS